MTQEKARTAEQSREGLTRRQSPALQTGGPGAAHGLEGSIPSPLRSRRATGLDAVFMSASLCHTRPAPFVAAHCISEVACPCGRAPYSMCGLWRGRGIGPEVLRAVRRTTGARLPELRC